MGCDIHGFVEVKIKGKWHATKQIPTVQSYDIFAILAGVRNHLNAVPISEPRGIPEDASEAVKQDAQDWEGEGHNHSWLSSEDFEKYDWNQQFHDDRISVIDKKTGKELYKAVYTREQDYTNPKHVIKHLVRTPKEILNGSQEWKDLIEELKLGDSQFEDARIVFWFDN